MPQADEGKRIDPPVSVPMAAKHSPAAAATPEPLDDPPGPRLGVHGLGGTSNDGLYPSMAPSVRFNLPSSTAPAARSFVTTVPSWSGTKVFSAAVPPIVGTPFV